MSWRARIAVLAVLNATATLGAAHQLAQTLSGDGLNVGDVGNTVTDSASSAPMLVLYAFGYQKQAAALASLLAADSPTQAPLDPATNTAAGGQAPLVVVVN